jgi:hypothetical protein
MSPKAQAKARQGTDKHADRSRYGVKLATPTQVGNARDKVSEARSLVHDLVASGMSRNDIRATLIQGGQVQTGTKLVSQLQPDGTHKVVRQPDVHPRAEA